jgi:hypothetical protein
MKLYNVNPEITEQELEDCLPTLETMIQGKVPNVLINVWEKHNGFHGSDENEDIYGQIWFYSITECIEFNQYIYIPGYLIIADEDGGTLVVMMKSETETKEIFTNNRSILFPMEERNLKKIVFDLEEWHKLGCYTDLAPESVTNGWGKTIVRLDKMPSDGLRGLNRIKKILRKNDWSMQKLLEIRSSIPYELIITDYGAANGAAFQINQYEKCVSLWKASDPTYEMPIWSPE